MKIYVYPFFVSIVLLFFLLPRSLKGQEKEVFSVFQFLESKGEIPDDFLTSWGEKYSERLKSEMERDDSKKDSSQLDQFWLGQHHAIDEILMSGKLSFGDPVSVYLNKIVDRILADDPVLRKQIRVYYYHSPGVNAFAVADGIIAIYTGLLAHVKSEAEIAFVLSHEIAHYVEEHMYASYEQAVEKSKINTIGKRNLPLLLLRGDYQSL